MEGFLYFAKHMKPFSIFTKHMFKNINIYLYAQSSNLSKIQSQNLKKLGLHPLSPLQIY